MAEKLFAYYKPHADEEIKKLTICNSLIKSGKAEVEPLDKKLCKKCRVFLMSDRFLGKEFHKLLGISKNAYPYVLIADAVGCNLKCWFCYAHKLLDISGNKEQMPTAYLCPKDLAKCFICKIQFAFHHINDPREPLFSRIRITGGEPLAHIGNTFIDRQ